MKISPATVLIVISVIGLVVGVAIFFQGGAFWVAAAVGVYVDEYGNDLKDALSADVCVDKTSGIDFCTRSDKVGELDLGPWMGTLGSLMLATGFLVILWSLLGIIAGCKGYRQILVVMIILISGAIGLEAYLLDVLTNEESTFHDNARDDLLDKLKDQYKFANPPDDSSKALTQAFNIFMLKGECCGVEGREDFGTNLSYTGPDGNHFYFLNPPACYKRELLIDKKSKLFSMLQDCKDLSDKNAEDLINEEGCYEAIYKYYKEKHGTSSYAIAIGCIILHVIAVVLALMILMHSPNEELARKLSLSSQRQSFTRTAPPQTQSNHFLPFAKTSSFVHADPNRTKSTEIW